MKYVFLALLFFPFTCLAQSAGAFGSAAVPKIVVTPPPASAQTINPCSSGQCGFGNKKKNKRKGFGSRRKKAVSSFGKGGNGRRAKAIDGGASKSNKSRKRYRYR